MTPDMDAEIQALVERFARRENPLVGEILESVAARTGVSIEQMRSPARGHRITRARHIAIYMLHKHCRMSYPDLGKLFGGLHHTTAYYAVRKLTRQNRSTWSGRDWKRRQEAQHVA